MSARGDVIVHDRAPGLVTGVLPFLAVTRRTAEVQLQHGIATVGQQLHQRIVTPPVARLGPAVRQHHGGQPRALGRPEGQRQVTGNADASRARHGDRLGRRQLRLVEPEALPPDGDQPVAGEIQHVITRRRGVAVGNRDDLLAVTRGIEHRVIEAGQRVLQGLVDCSGQWIDKMNVGAVGFVQEARDMPIRGP